jgi:hypothetical protein
MAAVGKVSHFGSRFGRHIMFVLHPTSDYFVHLDNGLFVIDAHPVNVLARA